MMVDMGGAKDATCNRTVSGQSVLLLILRIRDDIAIARNSRPEMLILVNCNKGVFRHAGHRE